MERTGDLKQKTGKINYWFDLFKGILVITFPFITLFFLRAFLQSKRKKKKKFMTILIYTLTLINFCYDISISWSHTRLINLKNDIINLITNDWNSFLNEFICILHKIQFKFINFFVFCMRSNFIINLIHSIIQIERKWCKKRLNMKWTINILLII